MTIKMSELPFKSGTSTLDHLAHATYVDTPRGIYAPATGTQFKTTEKALNDEFGAVFKKMPLEEVIKLTTAWYKTGSTIGLWLLPVLLILVPIYPLSLALALLTWLLWELFASPKISVALSRNLTAIGKNGLTLLVNVLAWLALANWYRLTNQIGTIEGILMGVIGYVILRFELLNKIMSNWLESYWEKKFGMSRPDFLLQALIHKIARSEKVDVTANQQVFDRNN